MMLIVHISDLHFLPKGVLSFGKVDTHSHLVRGIAAIKAFDPRPDAVLITGNLMAYQALVDLLATLDLPLYPTAGNHDGRDLLRSTFSDDRHAVV